MYAANVLGAWLLAALAVGPRAATVLASETGTSGGLLLERGYELLPNARWREKLFEDDSRLGLDAWVLGSSSVVLGRDVSGRADRIDFALDIERSRERYHLTAWPLMLGEPYRPTVNERFLFENTDTGWGTAMQGLFYGLTFLGELATGIDNAVASH